MELVEDALCEEEMNLANLQVSWVVVLLDLGPLALCSSE